LNTQKAHSNGGVAQSWTPLLKPTTLQQMAERCGLFCRVLNFSKRINYEILEM
jgi:hypothetical protein